MMSTFDTDNKNICGAVTLIILSNFSLTVHNIIWHISLSYYFASTMQCVQGEPQGGLVRRVCENRASISDDTIGLMTALGGFP